MQHSRKYRLSPFLKLIKHGIILGNLVPVIAGFILALTPQNSSTISALLFAIIGTLFVIASATITNNIIDRDIDKVMRRTQNRPLVNGDISLACATVLALVFALLGFGILYLQVNILAGNIALIGFIDYVILYSLLFKRHSTLSILVGSISGATPPLIGYVAASNQLSWDILYLFIIFASWQIAHSYAIAMYREQDYSAANIPMPSRFFSLKMNQRRVVGYILLMLIATIFLVWQSFNFIILQLLTVIFIASWLLSAIKPIHIAPERWGKKQFINSLGIIMGLCALIMIDHGLPLLFA